MSVIFYGTVENILALLTGRADEVHLDRAALELATIEYPELDPQPYLEMLDSYAATLAGRIGKSADGPAYVAAANQYLFDELGFAGNTGNYYDPRNSCLNEVLESRKGIPITLALVYMEVARRLERPVKGIGLPGHFVVRYDDGAYSAYVDPFHGGRVLTVEDCYALARRRDPADLAPVSKRQILMRMLANLRNVYLMRSAHAKALEIVNLFLAVHPGVADEYKQRAILHIQMKNIRAAEADLQEYLRLAPEAPDRAVIEKQIVALKQYRAGLN